jgi:hypothetical protein
MRAENLYPTQAINFDIYPSQDNFGAEIANIFLDRSMLSILALALTQSGKTGSMLGVIKHCLATPSLALPLSHIFIITGYSSVQWTEQTRDRFPPEMAGQIFHRNQFDSFVKQVRDKTNVLIIIDEIQIAFGENQSVHNAFRQACIMDKEDLYKKDVKIVHFTATPRNTEQFKRSSFSKIIFMMPPPGYISVFQLLESNRIRFYKDLAGLLETTDYSNVSWKDPNSAAPVKPSVYENIKEISEYMNTTPKYHIVRTGRTYSHDVTILNFMKIFPDCAFVSEMETDLDILLIKPSVHTFVFIKDKLRCAKTIHKEHLGVLYDRKTRKSFMNSTIQGLAGRLTGYHTNQNSVVFTNPVMIRKYHYLWTTQFEGVNVKSIFIGQ